MTPVPEEQMQARKQRILHVIDSINPAAGGPTEAVLGLIAFAPEGISGEVVSLDDPASPFLASFPCPVHALGRGSAVIGYSRTLDRWLRDHAAQYDGILIHGLWRYISFATWRAARGRVPYLVFPHGMLDPYFKRAYPLKHLQKWVYWRLFEHRVLRDAEQVLFTTTEESLLAEQSFSRPQWRGLVVPIGAKRPPGEAAALQEAFTAAHPALREKRFLLFLGRIHRKKGCDLLIEAFLTQAPQHPQLHLVMAGPDQQGWAAELRQRIAQAGFADRVHWPGMLHGDVKWGAFYAAEVFVLPSHQENFGIAVAESMACGRAVLLSDKVNIAQEIASCGAGLMEPDTQQGTNALLSRWLALEPWQRREMESKALACFQSRYDMEKNTRRIVMLFDRAPEETGSHQS